MRVCRIRVMVAAGYARTESGLYACRIDVAIMIKKNGILSLLPFILFWAGYFCMHWYVTAPAQNTPNLIGKQLAQATQILAQHNLNVRILTEKEESDILPTTVLQQKPAPGKKIKDNQPVFLVISKKPVPVCAPVCTGKQIQEVQKMLENARIKAKIYELPALAPTGICIGQSPCAGTPLEQKKLIIYVSSSEKKQLLFPDLKQSTVAQVQEFLALYKPQIKIIHTHPIEQNHICTTCIIVDQKPLAGSIMKEQTGFIVQLQVQ